MGSDRWKTRTTKAPSASSRWKKVLSALAVVLPCVGPTACAGDRGGEPGAAHVTKAATPGSSAAAGVETRTWAEATRSPWPEDAAHEVSACGAPDAALERLARRIAEERARGLGSPDADEIAARMRAMGVPHTSPRLLTASGRAPIERDAIRARLGALRGERARCGVAVAATPHGGEVLVAIAADALADLEPLPIRARTGEWLSFDARLRVAARSAKLVVLGPRGAPRTVPTSLDPAGHARARFALDSPGSFLVQLVADTAGGPRPLLEARVFADVAPPAATDLPPAPGEDAAGGAGDALALGRMLAALREVERLPALAGDPDLDALARAHAAEMTRAREVAHDLGDGDLRARFEAAGLSAKTIGENVAHAESVARAHRVLYASPSHRMNLLRADYTHVGVGVALADDGSAYVCEVFANRH